MFWRYKVADYLESTIVLISHASDKLEEVGQNILLMATAEAQTINHAKEAVVHATQTYELGSETKNFVMEETYFSEMKLVPRIKYLFQVILVENETILD